jgi:trimeric autotransporter adhesin
MRRMRLTTYAGVACLLVCVPLCAQQPSSEHGAASVGGSGKTNFIPIWTNSTTLGSSTLFQKSGRLGIGTTAPAATLDVNGTAKFRQAVTFASGQTFPGTASLAANTFTAAQTIASGDLSISSGNLDLPQTTGGNLGVLNLGGVPFIHACCSTFTGNTFVGSTAGNFIMTGSSNTAVGAQALYTDTSGYQNTAIGYQALFSNTTGVQNSAIGIQALYFNTIGAQNTASGISALFSNSSGSFNTASGYDALGSNTTGQANTALGGQALQLNTTGHDNTAVGLAALRSNVTGDYITALGDLADVGSDGLINSTAVGACAKVSASNALVLGAAVGTCGGGLPSGNIWVAIDTASPTNILTVLQGGGHAISDGWDVYSSRRWKSNIQPLHGALGKVERLRGVSYTYTPSGKQDIGMIAEEVGKVVPEVVSYEGNGRDARGIDYARLTALLVEAVKQQQAEIKQEQAQIDRLESKVRALERNR